jgi:hypothetical protein
MTRDRNDAAKRLIHWHFEIEPELQEVWLIIDDGTSPDEPIKLLEVNAATPATGSVEPFSFPPADDIPYRTIIAEVTPEEFEALRERPNDLPPGWDLSRARRFQRPKAA